MFCDRTFGKKKGCAAAFYLLVVFYLLLNVISQAATHYVVTNNPSPVAPYTNWGTAGTSILDVVNAAMTNIAPRTVWVSNGVYLLTNQIAVTNAVTIQSVHGRDFTTVNGNRLKRCFNLSHSDAIVDGFAVTNGYINNYGGGIYANPGNVYNCLISGNTSSNDAVGGGVYLNNGKITNCIINGNTCTKVGSNPEGGGVYAGGVSLVTGCTIFDNVVTQSIPTNTQGCYGGGIYADGSVVISNCTVYNNKACQTGTGGGVSLRNGTIIRNCLIYNNFAQYRGGGVWTYCGTSDAYIQNCTIVSNTADSNNGGGIMTQSAYAGFTNFIENTIVYFNTGGGDSNFFAHSGPPIVSYTCTAPAQSGAGNTDSDPQFAARNSGNFRLALGSPCINTGTNAGWMTFDLDGHSRIDRFSGMVDMGCYEYLPQGTIYSVP